MDEFTLRSELDYFAEHEHIFVLDDLLAFAETNQSISSTSTEHNLGALQKLIANDHRFLTAYDEATHKPIFISKKTLTSWYIDINVTLARAKTSRLKTNNLGQFMNSLLEYQTWQALPREFATFGESLSLLTYGIVPDEYAFPLAHVLSFVTSRSIDRARWFLSNLLCNDTNSQTIPIDLDELTSQSLRSLTQREQRVIELRFGLRDGHLKTLEEIGQEFKLTRERIRQIEKKALRKMNHPTNRDPLLVVLLAYILANKGSLLVNSNSAFKISFVAERLSIPVTQFPLTKLLLLGQAPFSIDDIKLIRSKLPDLEAFGTDMCENLNVVLSRQDWLKIAEDLSQPLLKHLKKTEKVYLALKQLGEASHYEKIHEMYCELFPEERPTAHSIHAMLTREENGVVWVGRRGTFSLEEWGDSRPSMSIFDSVADIVIKRYEETEEPVPLSTIQAEIGKYRKYVNKNSITLAAYLNPDLEQIGNYSFIPKETAGKEEQECPEDEMDELLRDFEDRSRHFQNDR